MISSRAILSFTTGFFCLSLGVFALIQNPRNRLNRNFAFFNLAIAPYYMPLTLFLEGVVGHGVALFLYRFIQFLFPVSLLFFLNFVHDLAGEFDRRESRRLRIGLAALLVFVAPIYATRLIVVDFVSQPVGNDIAFTRTPGSLFFVSHVLFLLFFVLAFRTIFRSISRTSGTERNQLRFILFGIWLGFIGTIVQGLSLVTVDLLWIYFPTGTAMFFCFAYAIFKHDLLEFGTVMRRLAIYAGVYASVLSLPLFLFFPFRSALPLPGEGYGPKMMMIVIALGAVFSAAPQLSAYLRRKSEEKRWRFLQEQLETALETSEKLFDETGLTSEDIAARVCDLLEDFYTRRMKTPLTFVAVMLADYKGLGAISATRGIRIDEPVAHEFLAAVAELPPSFLSRPFSRRDVALAARSARADGRRPFDGVRRYMGENDIDLVCPCLHGSRLCGVVCLGPKRSGIFWTEEKTTLSMIAAHVAAAVRKSELLVTNKELQDLDRLKTEFISNITHEFKTPLQIVDNAVDLLMRDAQRDTLDRTRILSRLIKVKNSASLLERFIQNLLDVARIEQSKVDLRIRTCEIGSVVRRAVELVTPLAEKKGLAIDFEPNGAEPVAVDVDKMAQVFSNLLSNAIKFTDRGGVRVSLERRPDAIRIAFADSGRGIDGESLTSIFEKFFRAPEDGVRNTDGAGLGLAIAKGWVDAHRGRIWAESAGIGQGATFVVEIPFNAASELS